MEWEDQVPKTQHVIVSRSVKETALYDAVIMDCSGEFR